VADFGNSLVREIAADGTVSTLIRTPDGPSGVALDGKGNLYVSVFDIFPEILQVSLSTGKTTVLSGNGHQGFKDSSLGMQAQFSEPAGLAVDKNGNVYVADEINQVIRMVTPTGATSTFAGIPDTPGAKNGAANIATFRNPLDLVFDAAGNLYIADSYNEMIRKIAANGIVSTLAGAGFAGYADGTGAAAGFANPVAITADSKGNLYVADNQNNVIRMITPAGLVSTIAGSGNPGSADGIGTAASFYGPQGITCDANGMLWVADGDNNTIRKITLQ
jgi:sugar lactone lactonase YvrE